MLSSRVWENNNTLEETQFSSIDVSCSEIKILDKLKPKFVFISRLYLDHNHLITLNGIQQFQNLQILSFNFNHVACFSEVKKIKNQFFITQLAFIGNPLEADTRANKKNLKQLGFTNLIRLNELDQSRIGTKKSKNIYYYQTEPDESRTERFRPKYTDFEPQKSRRLTTKMTQMSRPRKQSVGTNLATHIKQNPQKTNISTTLNRSQEIQTNSNRNKHTIKSIRLANKGGQENDKNVDIRPFHDVEQSPDEAYEEQASRVEQSKNDDGIGAESSIKNGQHDNDIQFMNRTGHFDDYSDFPSGYRMQTANMRKQKDIKFAIQFLQQQKQQIAEAFRKRYIKQKIFGYWFQFIKQGQKNKVEMKRKAWAAIRIFNSLSMKR